MQYVGETNCKIHRRLTDHRSDIIRVKDSQVATHFNQVCPGLDNLAIIPVEKVPRLITDTFMGLVDKVDLLSLLKREQHWIRKLKLSNPFE